jgi:hypothetical protein
MRTILHKRGDDFRQVITTSVDTADPYADDRPDVRNGTVESQIRSTDYATVLQTLTSEYISGSETERTDVLSATAAETEEWSLGTYAWDVLFTDADGVEVRTQTVRISVIERVTDV